MRIRKDLLTGPKMSRLLLLLGVVAVLLSFVPNFFLGGYSQMEKHDQFDGEVLAYIMHAKHLFSSSFDEFMNGMAATSLTPPSYGTVLFYILFEPYTAFFLNYMFVAVVGFVGMYLFLNKILDNKWLAAFIGLLYSQLPFYSVYGLSVMGQPLLFYACLCIWTEEKPLKGYLLTGFFAAFTSLVLVGYADILILLGVAVVMQIRKHPFARRGWIQLAVLVGILLLPNLSLIAQIVAPTDVVSHKSELTAGVSGGFSSNFKYAFRTSLFHAVSLHNQLPPWLLAASAAAALFYNCWTKEEKRRVWWLWGTLAAAAGVAAIYALWRYKYVVAIRNFLGGFFVSFQADRFYWLNPVIWFTAVAVMTWLLLRLAKQKGIRRFVAVALTVILIGNFGLTVYRNSYFNMNTKMILNGTGEGNPNSWNSFYSPDVFEEIEEYIGLPQEEYRVGSVALYPAVPLYNGFYCIDGYSNNYDVEYKHAFREIISKELEKNSGLKSYYDGWGNRCYIFCAELGQNYYFSKTSEKTIQNLELDHDALKKLNCDYIMSGLKIENCENSGLEFLDSFETDTSYYKIWLYKVA